MQRYNKPEDSTLPSIFSEGGRYMKHHRILYPIIVNQPRSEYTKNPRTLKETDAIPMLYLGLSLFGDRLTIEIVIRF